MTLDQAVLQAHAIGLPRLEAHMLVLHAVGQSPHARAWLLAHGGDAMAADAERVLHAAVQRRLQGEPVAYITGSKEFFGLTLAVDARVLDPRDDTETLVEWALEKMDAWPAATGAKPQALDLGTGSGAIALALKHSRPDWNIHALDASTDALTVAQANAVRLHLPVQWHHGSWMEGMQTQFALIVSNPPYIAAQDEHLAALTHEPLQALASGDDGLDDIRTIIRQAPERLLPGAWLLLEHGYDQAPAVCALLQDAGFAHVQSRNDLAGVARCSGGLWHP